MKTIFSHDVRVVMCKNCGAPIEVSTAGGSAPCSYCGAQMQLIQRKDEPVEPAAAAQQMSEAQRLVMLQQQDGKPMVPPASIQSLLQGGQLPAWKVQEAVAVWQATRQELESSSNYDAAERLLFLTMILSNHFSEQESRLHQRAMYESALEVFTLPRHRQMMRCYLARNAALEGDLQAAEQWIAPCNPRSEDLQSDSAYRVTRATIDTARRDFNAVINVLGREFHSVPIMDAMDAMAVVLRASAWEQLGHVDVASQQISQYMGEGGASGRTTLQRVIGNFAKQNWNLCQGSFQTANAAYSQEAGKVAASRASGGIGLPFLVLGLLMTIGTIIFVVAALTVVPEMVMGIPGVGGGVGLTGIIFTIVGYFAFRASRQALRLRMHGLQATGQIVSVEGTGTRINNVPQMRVTVLVQLPNQAPYQAATKMLLHPHMASQLAPGSAVSLRVDPDDGSKILIESD